MSDNLSKADAAEYLGVSVRALERYTQQARVGVVYAKGRAKPTPTYEQGELDRFKAELEKVTNRPAVQVLAGDDLQSDTNRQSSLATLADGGGLDERGLQMVQSMVAHLSSQVIAQVMESQSATTRHEDMAELADSVVLGQKLLLKLDEAALLTGLSRQTLRTAIAEETLKASLIGRTWRIKRADLDAYIEAL